MDALVDPCGFTLKCISHIVRVEKKRLDDDDDTEISCAAKLKL